MSLMTISLSDKRTFHLKATKSTRFSVHGQGTFLETIEEGDVEITADALTLLLAQKERSGLQGMEFWSTPVMLAWGSTSRNFKVPANCVNVPAAAKTWIKKLFKKSEPSDA